MRPHVISSCGSGEAAKGAFLPIAPGGLACCLEGRRPWYSCRAATVL